MADHIRHHVRRAAEAHTDLSIFAAIVSVLEGGSIYGARSRIAAETIIKICQKEQSRLLSEFDFSAAAAAREPSND